MMCRSVGNSSKLLQYLLCILLVRTLYDAPDYIGQLVGMALTAVSMLKHALRLHHDKPGAEQYGHERQDVERKEDAEAIHKKPDKYKPPILAHLRDRDAKLVRMHPLVSHPRRVHTVPQVEHDGGNHQYAHRKEYADEQVELFK